MNRGHSEAAVRCPQCLGALNDGASGHTEDCPTGQGRRARWWEGTLAVLDFETTSPDPREARIVSYALVYVLSHGHPKESWSIRGIVDPGVPIPEGATAVHGITTERAKAEGERPVDALVKLAGELARLAVRDVPLVIFNAPFDWTILHHEVRRHFASPAPLAQLPIVDPLILDRTHDKWRKGRRTLGAAVLHYCPGLMLEAHDAWGDCLGAAAVVRALAKRYPQVGELEPRELHQLQVGYHQAWLEDFNSYRAKRGQEPVPDRGWPLDV